MDLQVIEPRAVELIYDLVAGFSNIGCAWLKYSTVTQLVTN